MAEEPNLFDQVRASKERLDDINLFISGRKEWNIPGLLTLLQQIQAQQESLRWRVMLLSVMVGLLIVLCCGILVLLFLNGNAGMAAGL